MARRLVWPGFVCTVAVFGTLVGVHSVQAAGYWNVPSTFCQWLGSGFGGGYHAPLMLGPPQCDCFRPANQVRLPYAPNPYACQPPCDAGCGAYRGGPPMMPGYQPGMQVAPASQNTIPEPMPQVVAPGEVSQEALPPSAAGGAIFAAPVEP